jgi:hypothetical protein
MTSHRGMLREHSLDELDRVIRWALWERVSGSSPSPWECDRVRNRICGLVERRGVWHLMRRGVSLGTDGVVDSAAWGMGGMEARSSLYVPA